MAAHYLPFHIVIPLEPGDSQRLLAERLPFLAGMSAGDGGAAAYVCRDFTCQQPATTVAELNSALAADR
jgi:uncharacterized protein